ncbi:MAG: hypothetical protein Q8M31_11230 [Beijerinckiaceae bacterium]|nr:hypothetical protein [Beijerinckiaceae bacterium]
MMFLRSVFLLLAVVFGAAEAAAQQTLIFVVRNETNSVINYKLWSQSRNIVWPGANTMYSTDFKGDQRSNRISCIQGESICYGAWFRNNPKIVWGAGTTGKGRCADCCYICNGERTKTKVLTYTPAQQGFGR